MVWRLVLCGVTCVAVGACGGNSNTGGGSGGAGGGAGDPGPPLDWFTSSCGDLGGVETPAGACFVGCKKTEECPADTSCRWSGVWFVGNCTPRSSDKDAKGCGPNGWHNRSWGCYMKCPSAGADDQCPAGFRCIEQSSVSGEYFCTGYSGSSGSGCSVPCPSGCCSTTGYSCCEPPFCSGACAGSKCC